MVLLVVFTRIITVHYAAERIACIQCCAVCECRAVFFLCCMKFHKSLSSLLGRSSNKANNHIVVYLYFCALLCDHQRNQNHKEKKELSQSASGSQRKHVCAWISCLTSTEIERWPKKEKKEMEMQRRISWKRRNESRTTATHMRGMAWQSVSMCFFISLESFHPHSISIKWNTYIVYCHSPKMANKLFWSCAQWKKKLVKRYVIPSKQVHVSCQR